jgi:hypothetical protein
MPVKRSENYVATWYPGNPEIRRTWSNLTVGELIEWLSDIPKEFLVSAYEGETNCLVAKHPSNEDETLSIDLQWFQEELAKSKCESTTSD